MAIKYLKTAKLKGETVFMRVDVNVPLTDAGGVADDFRIRSIVPTIEHLLAQGCKVILCGHLGRPDGQWVKKFSLAPVAQHLADALHRPFAVSDKAVLEESGLVLWTGPITEQAERDAIIASPAAHVILLENIRFYPEEERNEAGFAKQLALLADVYVNEAFAVDHRKAASITGVPKYIPAYAGLLLEKEIKGVERVLGKPKSPFVVMMGGAKISDKAKTLQNLGKRADTILVGGGLANLFFAARGYEIGKSKAESEAVKLAWQMDKNFKGKLVLPVDVVVANAKLDRNSIRTCAPHEVKKSELILDAGPKTILAFAKILKQAKTITWNGPLGFFEHPPFHHSTMALARVIGGVATGKAFAVVGGGETVDAIRQAHQEKYVDHVSTGGGALLEYLAGIELPGIKALE
ncbi:MAG: phosphoglycerate kinase [Candidatus Doudnabacteria bacterium]|nr:phosphoglycerate kinase [Candidatus Doudnabacteria bacterium]